MSASYATAALPEPHTILGQRLKPFCMGHWLILCRFNSPLCRDENPGLETPDDLVFAVFVCCHEPDEFMVEIESPELPQKLEMWGKEIGLFDFQEKGRAFMRYFNDATRQPKFWQSGSSDAQPTGTHWSQAVTLTLTGQCGYTEAQVKNAPFGKVISDFMRYCETQGSVRIMTEQEIEMIEAAEKEAAQRGA